MIAIDVNREIYQNEKKFINISKSFEAICIFLELEGIFRGRSRYLLANFLTQSPLT